MWLNGLEVSGRTRNDGRQLFRNARNKRYLLPKEPTAVEDVAAASAGAGAIEIYMPQEVRSLLSHTPARLLPVFAIGALAGLRC